MPFTDPNTIAAALDQELRSLPVHNTADERRVRRKFSRMLKTYPPALVLDTARLLLDRYHRRWHAYEMIADHPAAMSQIGEAELIRFGAGIDSWDTVDAFARTLAGPAWRLGQVSDDLIVRWAGSEDRWQRRAALVSTVAWNMRSQGGMGDSRRTLQICALLVSDHDDMVVKAMSWALRELVVHDPEAVLRFLDEHEATLAGRIKREVRNKITFGLKQTRKNRL